MLELQPTLEEIFHADTTSVDDYLQQVQDMSILTAIQVCRPPHPRPHLLVATHACGHHHGGGCGHRRCCDRPRPGLITGG